MKVCERTRTKQPRTILCCQNPQVKRVFQVEQKFGRTKYDRDLTTWTLARHCCRLFAGRL